MKNKYFYALAALLFSTSDILLGTEAAQFDPKKIVQDMEKTIKDLEELKKSPYADQKSIEQQLKDAHKNLKDIKEQYHLNSASPQPAPQHPIPPALHNSIGKETQFVLENAGKLGDISQDRIVLYGPKSNGRLWVAQRKAQEMGARFIHFSGYEIGTVKYGLVPGKKTLADIAASVEQHPGRTLVFIDDVEKLIQGGTSAALSIPDEFIQFMARLKAKGSCLIVGTDHFDLIDQSLLKPDRLNKYFSIEKPTLEHKQDLLIKLLPHLDGCQINKIARITDLFAFDEVVEIVSVAKVQTSNPTEAQVIQALKEYKKQKFAQEYSNILRNVGEGFSIIRSEQVNTTFKDIIGMEEPIEQVRDILDFIKSPDQFLEKGLTPPKGLILYGPPGNGKTHLVRAIAGETKANFISTTGSYFYNSEYKHNPSDANYIGNVQDSIRKIRNIFELARQLSPCIIFIDEFEIIGKAREGATDDAVSKVNQFLTEMDGLIQENQGHVFVITATNHLDSMDQALLRPGRFDRHVAIGFPKKPERKRLVEGFLKKIKIPFQGCIDEVVDMTAGMSVAYIKNLVNEAGLIALREKSQFLTIEHFKKAHQKLQASLSKIAPSQGDRASGDHPNFEFLMPEQLQEGFKDIGGYSKEKEQMTQFLELIKDPEKLQKLGARPIKGIVLHGPPGTGKTMMVRALAKEAKLSVINCSGAQFSSGGPRRVRELFNTARSVSPCIIFIDEFEVVAKDRKKGNSHHDVLNQFLIELDGVSAAKNKHIYVVITTNLIESLDKALIRPGRFDRHIHIGLPSHEDRVEIITKLLERYAAPGIKPKHIADISEGFSPAELQNLMNEAAIHAAMKKQENIVWENIEYAKNIVRAKG